MTEDNPGWDCATMGNLTCGAGSTSPTMGYHTEAAYYGIPDTAAQPGAPLDGIGFVIVLLVLWIARREQRN